MNTLKGSHRRGILKTLLGTSFASLFFPIERTLGIDERRLSFFHTHTLETLDVRRLSVRWVRTTSPFISQMRTLPFVL